MITPVIREDCFCCICNEIMEGSIVQKCYLVALIIAIFLTCSNLNFFVHAIPYISEDPNDVHFYLYLSSFPDPNFKQELVLHNIDSVRQSAFQAGQKTVFIIHGFRSSYLSEMSQIVKNAYLSSHFHYNYIVVDWEKLGNPQPPELTSSLYFLAVKNVPIVAQRVAEFVSWLKDSGFLVLDQIHMVGHSLGAHVSGLAGRNLQAWHNSEKIFRITGLDPAGPLFWPPVPERNLVKEDASFVDVIHTNMHQRGDDTYLGGDGHADFYPNGGVTQPGCALNDTGLPNFDFNEYGVCSHRFSYKLYVASFTKNFIACNCSPFVDLIIFHFCISTCPQPVLMGVYCPTSASGQYYLETTNPP
ncbi:lipase member H-A-like [Folsomia candida]|uniref:lipase member H-A-like n=1 Tax=Folsomia candida TaxID=158441 RepID=UPI001604EB0E|nr:lipase member H-A-like [Folsomia candida]